MGENFKQEQRSAAFLALAHGQKLGSLFQPNRRRSAGAACGGHRRLLDRSFLGRQAATTAIATGGNHSTTTLGGHARAETMAALTDELRRLIGTLHCLIPRCAALLMVYHGDAGSIWGSTLQNACFPGTSEAGME
jgi:hypothetical protein